MEEVKEPVLENWYVAYDQIVGTVFNDDRWPDGTEITTARVARWDFTNNCAYTVNTKYKLGTPMPRHRDGY